jgi:hypothetical protein
MMKTILLAGAAVAVLAASPAWVNRPAMPGDRFQLAEGNGTWARVAEGNGTWARVAEGNGTLTRVVEGNGTQARVV